MKALVITARGPGKLELHDLPIPKIKPHEVLIRVRACGILGKSHLSLREVLSNQRN